jgi:DNA-binding transcriptional ArsR family regulator
MGHELDVFAAIAAPARREILRTLAAGEMPVTELASNFKTTLSAVSQQLTILREAGLVRQRKAGKQRLYSLNSEPLREVANWLEFYKPFWSEHLEKLGQYLEENP